MGVRVFVLSVVLVIVGAVTLALGVFNVGDQPLNFVYISIASCVLAAIFLGIGVLRGRPKRKPVQESGGEAEPTWAGASSWPSGDGDAERAAGPGAHVHVVSGDDDESTTGADAAESAEGADEGAATADERTSETAEPGGEGVAGAPQADDDEDLVVVPKRTGAKKAATKKTTAKKTTAKKASAKKATGKKTTGRKATAKKSSAAQATASADEDASPRKRTGKKATAKKTTAKKTTAKKATAKRTASGGGDDFEAVLGDVAGVGPSKRADLARHFGSVDGLRAASVEDLQEVQGISETLARRIHGAVR